MLVVSAYHVFIDVKGHGFHLLPYFNIRKLSYVFNQDIFNPRLAQRGLLVSGPSRLGVGRNAITLQGAIGTFDLPKCKLRLRAEEREKKE